MILNRVGEEWDLGEREFYILSNVFLNCMKILRVCDNVIIEKCQGISKEQKVCSVCFQHLKISVIKNLLARVAADSLFSDIKY